MCRRWVERLRRWDREGLLLFVSLQAPGVPARFPWIPADAYARALQVVAPDGRTWEGAGAAERLAHVLPGGAPLAFFFRIPLVRPVADAAYRWVAGRRHDAGCELHGS
jgi:predicted DCC family thiol-disulfide oxidoreductase YuxK